MIAQRTFSFLSLCALSSGGVSFLWPLMGPGSFLPPPACFLPESRGEGLCVPASGSAPGLPAGDLYPVLPPEAKTMASPPL